MGNRNIMKIIARSLTSQWKKGFEKYGHTIEDCPEDEYDWNVMALEEMADGLTYMAKENLKLRRIVKSLHLENDKLKDRINDLENY